MHVGKEQMENIDNVGPAQNSDNVSITDTVSDSFTILQDLQEEERQLDIQNTANENCRKEERII